MNDTSKPVTDAECVIGEHRCGHCDAPALCGRWTAGKPEFVCHVRRIALAYLRETGHPLIRW